MRRSVILIFLMALFASFLFCPYLYAQLGGYYPLEEKCLWEYETRVKTGKGFVKLPLVIKTEKTRIGEGEFVKKVYGDGSYEELGISHNGVMLYKFVDEDGGYESYRRPRMEFPFDIEQTKSFSDTYSYIGYDNKKRPSYNGTYKMSMEFMGREDVEVPAGMFVDCIKILKTVSWKDDDGAYGKDRFTVWMARGVGMIKMVEKTKEFDVEESKRRSEYVVYELKKAVMDKRFYGKGK